MTTSEIKQLAEVLAQNSPHITWVYVLLAVAANGIAAFFGSYFAEKAKNTATKEDIEQITHLIEGARADYTAKIESLKGSYHLRAVALERRLEVHQKAFALWRKLIFAVFTDEISKVCHECEDWWTDHCIYLAPDARDAFLVAVQAAHGHQTFARSLPSEKVDANWQRIMDAGNAIMKGADLPPLPSEVVLSPRPK